MATKKQRSAAVKALARAYGYADLNTFARDGILLFSMPGETIEQQLDEIVKIVLQHANLTARERK